ncbi:mechanosensitive ion channel domain-containing protein [Alteriqipengyuania sp. WL0013]|uniref:mechanosensitive ion channel family protein n=1 Tax=Alteriqipengyuania sp. WL0013 TaxID=3110773 RepID=UPI002C6E6685|nr:mechanosensitive ion channel domain-containing protein [Alteriqipengyuania sp. WL0013]MEB3415775.1 mechanosensitive ion channel domain-containing protein [Alteriqipengyuania sp. WL0013]
MNTALSQQEAPAPAETAAPEGGGDAGHSAPVGGDAAPAGVNAFEAPQETAVSGADAVRDAVASNPGTASDVIDTLDGLAISFADTRVSVWDGIVVLLVIFGVWLFAWLVSKLAHRVIGRITKLGAARRLLVEKLVTIVVWAGAILIGIDMLGIDLTALAVFSGAFGLAIGFGLQKTFGNLIAGIILLMDRSIKPGDVIAVADQAGAVTFGQIRKIGIRAVSVTTRDEREYLIPNENLMVNQVENWSYSSRNVRIQVPVGVSYNCDIKLAEKLMLEAATECGRVLKSPKPTCWLDAYGDSSVNFIIHCWIRDPEQGVGNVKSEVLKVLWEKFQANGIEIPFPQRDLNLRGNDQFDQLVAAISQRIDTPKE